jgi:DNA-binding CsgD family transcriptional regulator
MILALTEREKDILRLSTAGTSDYRIARKLKMDTSNVYRARKNAERKLERARADLDFVSGLKK